MASPVWEQVAEGSAFLAVLGAGWALAARDGIRRSLNERRAAARSRRAERAAVEATLEEDAFAPERIRAAVSEILTAAESRWRYWGGDRLSQDRADGAAIAGWVAAHGLAGAIHVDGEPRVDLLRIVNRDGEQDDRVDVRVRVHLELDVRRHWVDPHTIVLDERWTLGRRGPGWELLDGRGDRFADPVLSRPLIPAEWADEDRIREQVFTELADEGRPEAGPVGLGGTAGSPRARLLDLAVVDARFSPGLIDATVRHLLDAWEQETLAPAGRLSEITTPQACEHLLRGDNSDQSLRLAVRDIELAGWEPVAVAPDAIPPFVNVHVRISAIRYMTAIDGLIVEGTAVRRHQIELEWVLELAECHAARWRLRDSASITGML